MMSLFTLRLTGVVFALFVSSIATSNVNAVTSSAHATIDWGSLEITTYGDGALLALDDPFIANSALVTDEHGLPLSSSEQLFAPAVAAHPFFEANAGFAAFESDASAAAATAEFGTAFTESALSTSFLALGTGTALVTVGYAAGADIAGEAPESGTAAASGVLGVTAIDVDTGFEQLVSFDEASLARTGEPGALLDTGYLTALFDFSAGDYQLFRLDGAVSTAAVGTLATPVPAALPLMLSAVGLIGTVTRRKHTQ